MANNTMTEQKKGSFFITALLGIAAAVGLWAVTALTFGLAKADWQVGEMLRQYLVAVGAIKEFETLVDFYTHIKGIEYIICVAFLGAFPAFYKYMNTTKAPIKTV
jgi:hypothetical protein